MTKFESSPSICLAVTLLFLATTSSSQALSAKGKSVFVKHARRRHQIKLHVPPPPEYLPSLADPRLPVIGETRPADPYAKYVHYAPGQQLPYSERPNKYVTNWN